MCNMSYTIFRIIQFIKKDLKDLILHQITYEINTAFSVISMTCHIFEIQRMVLKYRYIHQIIRNVFSFNIKEYQVYFKTQ